ncbi:MAG: hypothetical protein M1832_002180 [Thelocarpon impressellum]|nr:MAG: hypothetical protein M1832_002180 [Thelocarpon impressellum]
MRLLSGERAKEEAERLNLQHQIIGIDISPHLKPDETPPNLWLQLDDLNRAFTFQHNTFDFVHSRLVANGINKARWPSYLRDIVRVLKPGGWVQMVEVYYNCQSDNGSLTENHALRQWSAQYMASLDGIKDLRVPLRLGQMMTEAGLVELQTLMIPLPLCGWQPGTSGKLGGVADERPRSKGC